MKILFVNSDDLRGGAARAAYRNFQGLLDAGIDAEMLVYSKSGHHQKVTSIFDIASAPDRFRMKAVGVLDRRLIHFYPRRSKETFWSLNWMSNGLVKYIDCFRPDLIHLNWIGSGLIPLHHFPEIQQPIVWTLHDMWAFTGGCHYAGACERYQGQCGACPQLGSKREHDLSRWTFQRKQRNWQNRQFHIVCLSQWLADCTQKSALLKKCPVHVIPNGLDLDRFRPIDRAAARQSFGLPLEKRLILFGAMGADFSEKRKGFPYLQDALRDMSLSEKPELVVFGGSGDIPREIAGSKTHSLGFLRDEEKIARAYSSADVFVAPSTEDNLPNTVLEALACGVPCVAFRIGGMPDMIDHLQNGYLAAPLNTDDLRKGIEWVLAHPEPQSLNRAARASAEARFNLPTIAARHVSLYQQILEQ